MVLLQRTWGHFLAPIWWFTIPVPGDPHPFLVSSSAKHTCGIQPTSRKMLNTHKINIKKLFCELDIFKERDDEKFTGGNFRTA